MLCVYVCDRFYYVVVNSDLTSCVVVCCAPFFIFVNNQQTIQTVLSACIEIKSSPRFLRMLEVLYIFMDYLLILCCILYSLISYVACNGFNLPLIGYFGGRKLPERQHIPRWRLGLQDRCLDQGIKFAFNSVFISLYLVVVFSRL